MSHNDAAPFAWPVDLNVFPAYSEYVTTPVDFNTIRVRLMKTNKYATVQQVRVDVVVVQVATSGGDLSLLVLRSLLTSCSLTLLPRLVLSSSVVSPPPPHPTPPVCKGRSSRLGQLFCIQQCRFGNHDSGPQIFQNV